MCPLNIVPRAPETPHAALGRYAPIRTPARKLMGTPTPYGGTPLYHIPEETRDQHFDVPKELEGLPELKPEDQQYFGKLLKEVTLLVTCHCMS